MANPDGRIRAEAGARWRKNAARLYLPPRLGLGYGVDLNRNFASPTWGVFGTTADPAGETYPGPKAFSEPESRALQDLYNRREFGHAVAWHSFGNQVLWPWNDSDRSPPDDAMVQLGGRLAGAAGYDGIQGFQLYYSSGEETDYVYRRHGTFAYTVEAGSWEDGFDPDHERLAEIWRANLALVKELVATAANLR